jgi:glycosyltransferase involved in cell wall biosynthesis
MANSKLMDSKPSRQRYRVLHIITRLVRGGADKSTLHCIDSLGRERVDVDLIVGRNSDPSQMQAAAKIARVTKLNSLVRPIHPPCDLVALFAIYRMIKKNGYDMVHTHTAKGGFLGRLAARLAGTPCVIHGLHGTTFPRTLPWVSRRFYIALERLAAPWADEVVSVGRDLVDLYLSCGIGEAEQYTVIRSAIDLRPFEKARALTDGQVRRLRESLGVSGKDLVVGNVARLERRKGLHYYIQAARLLAADHENLKFLIVGEGEERRRLESQVRRAGLDGQVVFTGFREDIAEVMATFDIFAFTSLWEGLPQVIVQGAALGKPIVTFSVEGAEELIQDEESGYIVPARDVRSFAERLHRLCESAALREEMGRRVRERLPVEQWSPDVVSQQIAKLYEEHLNGWQERVYE